MRIGVEEKTHEIDIVLDSLNFKEIKLFELLIRLMKKGLTSSDILFLIFEELEKRNVIKGERGRIRILKKIDKNLKNELKNKIIRKIKRIKKIFVTPLEISKFYVCPRRLWLEKVVLSKQEKEKIGGVWDGELIHYGTKLLIERLNELDLEKIAKNALDLYKDRVTIKKEQLIDFFERFLNFINEEKFEKLLAERTIESYRLGLIGTPDIIAIKNDDAFPIDIKLGKAKKIKKEHFLQSIGEALLIEEFFRKEVEKIFIIYFGSKSIVELKLRPKLKNTFMSYKKKIERMLVSPFIPRISNLPNYKIRACAGCHVRKACELIENYKRIRV